MKVFFLYIKTDFLSQTREFEKEQMNYFFSRFDKYDVMNEKPSTKTEWFL